MLNSFTKFLIFVFDIFFLLHFKICSATFHTSSSLWTFSPIFCHLKHSCYGYSVCFWKFWYQGPCESVSVIWFWSFSLTCFFNLACLTILACVLDTGCCLNGGNIQGLKWYYLSFLQRTFISQKPLYSKFKSWGT